MNKDPITADPAAKMIVITETINIQGLVVKTTFSRRPKTLRRFPLVCCFA